jgi:hypothetical protein
MVTILAASPAADGRTVRLTTTPQSVEYVKATYPVPSLGSDFASSYAVIDLGPVPDVPNLADNYYFGGLTLVPGAPDTLVFSAVSHANGGSFYRVPLVRGPGGHITGFAGPSERIAAAPDIDGGATFTSDGTLLFSRAGLNAVGEVVSGSATLDANVGLTPLGVDGTAGGIAILPPSGLSR